MNEKRGSEDKTHHRAKTHERVSSGIHHFDKLTDGGFKKNSTNLVIGKAGSGKSIFALQFLIEGIKKDEKCAFISFEESKVEFYSNMRDLGWDLESLEKKGKFFFINYSPGKVKLMLEEGGGIIESLVLAEKITRIVIDSISSFILLFKEEVERRKATLMLFTLLRKWQTTTILTFNGDPNRDSNLATNHLEFESDSITLLYYKRAEEERNRYLEILKMRGTNHSNQVFQFNISKGIDLTNKVYNGQIS